MNIRYPIYEGVYRILTQQYREMKQMRHINHCNTLQDRAVPTDGSFGIPYFMKTRMTGSGTERKERHIQPLADRTDFVKKEIENSQKEEQDAVNSYQRSVNGFHPRQDTTVMNDSVSSMRENAALMQQEINTSNQSYVDYADKLYQTTSENILTLQQHIEEAKETSNQAVTDHVV